jgi:VWFA-related protein
MRSRPRRFAFTRLEWTGWRPVLLLTVVSLIVPGMSRGLALPIADDAADGPVVTACTLLIGRTTGAAPGRPGSLTGPGARSAGKELVELADKLKASFNLSSLEVSVASTSPLSPNQEMALSGTGGYRLLVTPTAIGATEVTYQVRVMLAGRAVLDKAMVVERGHRTMFAKPTAAGGDVVFVVLEIPSSAEQVASAPSERPDLPAYRTHVTLVQTDVRVVGVDGRPITDLRRDDFTILEDGVRQKIAHFLPSPAAATPVDSGPPALRVAPSDALSVDQNRLFLIVLGGGRIQQPFKGFDALVDLVKNRLLPQDRVAVLAFDRATDFTSDHAAVVRLLEKLCEGSEAVEHRYFAPWTASGRMRFLQDELRREVDRLFVGPGLPPARHLHSSGGPDADVVAREMQWTQWEGYQTRARSLARDRVLDASLPPGTWKPETSASPNTTGPWTGADPFTRLPGPTGLVPRETVQLERLFAAIEFMRYLAGEKHLVFVTESNFSLPRRESDQAIAALANDAGVTIDTIQTGGLSGDLIRSSLQAIAQATGGLSALFKYPQAAVERLSEAMRFKYVIAYHPSNPPRDDRYRRLTVKVNRPGAVVLSRSGYYASDVLVPSDPRAFAAFRRILAAGMTGEVIDDIGLKATTSWSTGRAVVTGTIDAGRVGFATANGRHTASLELAAFCSDARENAVGEAWQRIDLSLSEATYKRVQRDGITYSITVPTKEDPRWSKVVVYDTGADRLGSVAVKR